MIDVSSLIGRLGCHGKRKRRDERRSVRIILSMQFSTVGIYDSADAIQTKAIMALTDSPNRFAPPILGGQVKTSLWFMQGEEELVVIDFGFREERTFATIMPKGIGEKLVKCFLQKLRINVQHRIAELPLPTDFAAVLWEIVLDLRAQIFDKIGSPVRDQVGCDLADCSGKPLQSRSQTCNHFTQAFCLAFEFFICFQLTDVSRLQFDRV